MTDEEWTADASVGLTFVLKGGGLQRLDFGDSKLTMWGKRLNIYPKQNDDTFQTISKNTLFKKQNKKEFNLTNVWTK